MANILFIANSIALYGANRSMLELAKGLKERRQGVFFFFPKEGNISERRVITEMKQELQGFTYVFLHYCRSVHSDSETGIKDKILRSRQNRNCLLKMQQYIIQWNIDIIHTNSFTHRIGARLSERVHKPHVWHIREALKEDYNLLFDSRLLYKYSLKKTSRVICISDYVKRTHEKMLMGVPVVTLYNGFDIRKYLLEGVYLKKKDIFSVIICGVIRESKGQLEAVKAFERLIHYYKVQNVHLQMIGDGDKNYIRKITDFIKKNRLDMYVDILPFKRDLRELRRNADIALVCSRNEAFGRVTIESMLSENLVIGCDSAGTSEIIRNGVTGYLYEPGNTTDLCRKIYYVIQHWDEQGEIIKAAKKYAISNYNIERYTIKMIKLYETLIRQGKRKDR